MPPGNSIPGQRAGVTTTPRDVLWSDKGARYVSGVIDATNSYDGANTSYETLLRPGTIMAQYTTSKKWVPCKRTLVNMTGATATLITVDDARAFKVGDVIKIDTDDTITITAINYTTNVLTIASTTVADNDVVVVTAAAGSEVARGILNETVNLKDEDGVNRDKTTGMILVAGFARKDMCYGDLTNILLATNKLSFIQWAEDHGQI